jgi:hypothetical protein
MKRFGSLVLVLLVLAASASASFAYQVASGHPRLFFLASELPALRAKCTGPLASDYNDLKSYCDSNMNESLPLASIDFYEDELAAYSFAYLMSQNTAYAARAKQIATFAMGQGYAGQTPYTNGMSLFYDWCYGYLTAAERQTFGTAVATSGKAYLASQNWTAMNNYHSKASRLADFAYTGIALYGDGVDDAAAVSFCNMFHEHTFGAQHTIACIDEIASDGSYFEGDYNMLVLGEPFREGCWLWATATDEDAFDVCGNLQNMIDYYLYDVFAKNGPGSSATMSASKQGDSKGHTVGSASVRVVMQSLARKYQDGRGKWLAGQIVSAGLGYVNRPDRWKLVVYTDTALATEAPPSPPPSRCFQDMGTVYMRSGWNLAEASTDVYAVFRCEQMNAGHTNAHQNHFLIARGNDLLAVDSGVYDGGISAHHMNYFERTIAHNTVTVYNPNETTFGSYANDGGQIPPSENELPVRFGDASLSDYYRGEIVGYRDDETFTYVKGDATAAYDPSKVQLFTREMVYLKPDIFVILDRVRATSATYKKRWLLHSVNQPTVTGDTVMIQEGTSRLFVKSLLPDPRQIVSVGGAGRQFDVNGVNYPPSQAVTGDMGAWRLEVSPSVNAEEQLFLHVLYVCGSGVSVMPEATLVDGGAMVGVEVAGRVVMFSKTGATVDSETYEYGD